MAAARTQPPKTGKGWGGALGDTIWILACLAGRLVLETAKRPKLLLFLAVLSYSVFSVSEHTLRLIVLPFAVASVVWYVAHRSSFEAIVIPALRNMYRRTSVYKPKWRRVMRANGLHHAVPQHPDRYPQLQQVECTPWMDRLLVKPCKGSIEDYRDRAPAFALAFGAETCRVKRAQSPDMLWLELRTGDPLAESLKPPQPDENVDLERVQVGITEDGDPWVLRILGRHLLIAGETGAGKSSLIWAILWALAPAIRDGLIEVWAVDPKGGMELDPGRDLFTRYADTSIEDMMGILEDAVARMDRRKQWAKANRVRKHTPTVAEPMILVVVDEGAVLNLLADSPQMRTKLDRLCKLLLTQGRAPGVGLITALQEPTKATMETRGLYPDRVQFRTMERRHFGMTLAPGILDLIDPGLLNMPGKAFSMRDGGEPQLGRVFHIENENIELLSRDYRPVIAALEEEVGRVRSVA